MTANLNSSSSPTTATFTGAVEQFYVQTTGYYDILVQGSGGGGVSGFVNFGGLGAYEKARFYLTSGTELNVVVGSYGSAAGGGGGASIVWINQGWSGSGAYNYSNLPAHPLIEAGGGGGRGFPATHGGNATFTLGLGGVNASDAQGSGGSFWPGATGGYGGAGGVDIYNSGGSGGGSGWRTVGNDGVGPNSGAGGGHFDGGVGYYGLSGFGGAGGESYANGGGGGGYNGGAGGNGYYGAPGGGGGSFISSDASAFISAGNSRNASGVQFSWAGYICYLPGTLILTTRGEVAIEDLNIGDLLPTLSGQDVPIKWVGIQQFMGQYASKDASPVRFQVGSLGEGLPKRDLYVSAGHSMKIGDHLVDARLLVNGVTITQRQRSEQLEYYHIDLGEHHCILAEGVWSESYLEWANRESFVNADEFYDTHRYHLTNSTFEKCLPHVADYQDPRHAALFESVLAHIPAERITTDPDLHLLADGKRLDPYEFVPQAFMFRIPLGTQVLRLKSRAGVPCELGLPADDRQLGFCIYSLSSQLQDGAFKVSIEPHHASLKQGFHESEGTERRWTDGNALLPNMLLGDGTQDMVLTIKGKPLARYHIVDEEREDEAHSYRLGLH